MDWLAANPERRMDPRVLWPGVRSIIMLGVNYGPDENPLDLLKTAHARRDFGLCAGRRLSRRHQEAPEDAGAMAGGDVGRRSESIRRHRRRDGKAAGAGGGTGLAGQAHQSGFARIRLLAVSRRDLHRVRTAARRGRQRSLRLLQRLPGDLPDRGIPRALQARCAALHFVSDDREQGSDPARISQEHRQPHLWLRRLPRRVPVEQICAGWPRSEARRTRGIARTVACASWRGSTTPRFARCSRNRRSSASAATVLSATC